MYASAVALFDGFIIQALCIRIRTLLPELWEARWEMPHFLPLGTASSVATSTCGCFVCSTVNKNPVKGKKPMVHLGALKLGSIPTNFLPKRLRLALSVSFAVAKKPHRHNHIAAR